MQDIIKSIAQELTLKDTQVHNTVELLFQEDCTIPFVARYRKEKTGSLDEVQIRDIRDRFEYLRELEGNKEKYLKVVAELCAKKPELQKQFPELEKKFKACKTKQELEDLYLPFKPKRRTRAQIAKEKGLEPLAEAIFNSPAQVNDLAGLSLPFITKDKEGVADELRVKTIEEALAGAGDILAERFAETAELRAIVRRISQESGYVVSKRIEDSKKTEDTSAKATAKDKEDKAAKYQNYFDYKEPLLSAAGHRIMAVRRGEAEKILRVTLEVDEQRIASELETAIFGTHARSDVIKTWLQTVIADAYRRLLSPSIETELRLELKARAEEEAIKVFSKNLENLLLLPPIPKKIVMGIDPGIRTGSKVAVVSETGKMLAYTTVYPTPDKEDSPKSVAAKQEILKLIKQHAVEYVAIGNGTGSREISKLVVSIVKENDLKNIKRLFVNEAGASVYSTDDIAREEFPDLDPTIRSAISIARRLQDPLAELVKIDPRSIGVGQYQHDVNVNKLKNSLEEVVESCVNRVGVNLNTASFRLLSYVSGIGAVLAKNIVSFRDGHGEFKSRQQLLDVSGFGAKAFTLAAGFLRVPGGTNPLDNSAVHPESYDIVERIIKDQSKDIKEIVGNKSVVEAIPLERYVSDTVGMPTLQDIALELIKPGRDPREDGTRLAYSDDVTEISDLRQGMELQGTVTNVTNFGAFIDIGVHQDGLAHISELSDQFVKDPSTVIAVGDVVKVRVLDVDVARKRISLSCRSAPKPAAVGGNQEPRREGAQSFQQRPAQPNQGHRPRPGGSELSGQRNRGISHSGGGGQQQRAQAAKSNFTMEDLLNKFNRK